MNFKNDSVFRNLLLVSFLFFTGAAHAVVNLSVDVNPSPAQPGQQVLVEMTVTNSGTTSESGLIVTLGYPVDMDGIGESGGLVTGPLNADASCFGGAAAALCEAGEILQWDLGSLTPGQAVVVSLSPSVAAGTVDGTLITFEATVSDDSQALATESATLTVDSTPALTVAIDEDQDPVAANGILTYTLRYGNRSANSVTGTQLNFTLPEETGFVSATGAGTLTGNEVSWNLATLPAGAVAQRVVEVSVDANVVDGTLLESEAVINGTSDALPTERRATETAYVGPSIPLALALNVNPLPAQPDEQVSVEMTVTNPTASTVFGGIVRLRYSSGMDGIGESGGLVTGPLNADASCFGGAAAALCEAGEILQWDLGPMVSGQEVNLSLSPTVASDVVNGSLIKWSVLVTEDGGSLLRGSETLPVGEGEFKDIDADGVNNENDNCIESANGPLIPDAGGNSQLDTDGDGFGNLCDADLDNTGLVNSLDLGLFKAVLLSSDPDADFNGDGIVNSLDLGIFKKLFLMPPGPSGLVP